jgi:hypothetical protein
MPDQTPDTNPPADRTAEIKSRHDSGQLLRRNDFEWLLSEHDRLTSDLTEERADHFETKEAYARSANAGVDYLARIDGLTSERDAALARVEELEGQLAKARGLHNPVLRYTPDGGETSYDTEAEAAEVYTGTFEPVTTFEVCSHCASIEMGDDGDRDYRESLWPCEDAKALGLAEEAPDEH